MCDRWKLDVKVWKGDIILAKLKFYTCFTKCFNGVKQVYELRSNSFESGHEKLNFNI